MIEDALRNVTVLREAAGLETLVGELLDQRFQRHAVLQGQARQGADAVHQSANGGTFLGHGDEQFARLAVLEQADREVAFVTGDVEFVRDRRARFRQPPAQRLARLARAVAPSPASSSLMRFEQAVDIVGRNSLAAFAGSFGVERLASVSSRRGKWPRI